METLCCAVHFVPGANDKMLGKSIDFPADALVLDLEGILGHARQQGLRAQDGHRVAAEGRLQGPRADGADEPAGDSVGRRRPGGHDGRAAGFLHGSERRRGPSPTWKILI